MYKNYCTRFIIYEWTLYRHYIVEAWIFHPYWIIYACSHCCWCMVFLTVLHIWYIIMIVLQLPIFLILMLVMYIRILPSVLHCLCMVPYLLVLMHNLSMIIAFFMYHQFTTPTLLLLVHSPFDCGTFLIHNSFF